MPGWVPRRNELSKIWRNLRCILLNEGNHLKRLYTLIPTIICFDKSKTMEIVKRSVIARGSG